MRLSRTDLLPVLTIIVGGVIGTSLSFGFLGPSPVADVPAPESVVAPSATAGTLNWPVEGELIYRFGREERPNGTVLLWQGIGIRATTGTPVQAVEAGTVQLAAPLEGYGLTVILNHGGGFYTLYHYLEDLGVTQGREVAVGQVVGTDGSKDQHA